jgi:hypothetical protein
LSKRTTTFQRPSMGVAANIGTRGVLAAQVQAVVRCRAPIQGDCSNNVLLHYSMPQLMSGMRHQQRLAMTWSVCPAAKYAVYIAQEVLVDLCCSTPTRGQGQGQGMVRGATCTGRRGHKQSHSATFQARKGRTQVPQGADRTASTHSRSCAQPPNRLSHWLQQRTLDECRLTDAPAVGGEHHRRGTARRTPALPAA